MKNKLQLDNLSIARQSKVICQNLSISFRVGEFWGILGANGRGKTTLLHTLAGMYPSFLGKILIGQENLIQIHRKKLATKVGLVLQEETHFFPTLVKDSILIGRYAHPANKLDKNNYDEILDGLNLKHLAEKNLLTLSGGEQQRVKIARIFYQQPEIYLLDEPTNHLDPHYQQKILTILKQFCQEGATVLMVGHNISQMELICDHYLLM
jgi:iron complex transport system ATP-binding protein